MRTVHRKQRTDYLFLPGIFVLGFFMLGALICYELEHFANGEVCKFAIRFCVLLLELGNMMNQQKKLGEVLSIRTSDDEKSDGGAGADERHGGREKR